MIIEQPEWEGTIKIISFQSHCYGQGHFSENENMPVQLILVFLEYPKLYVRNLFLQWEIKIY